MNAASDVWERIAGLRPRLHNHVLWHRHHYRGRPWWLLEDPAAGQHYTFTDEAHRLMGLLDGHRTLDQACTLLREQSDAPDTEEIMALLVRLQTTDLLQFDGPVDPAMLFKRWQQRRTKSRRNAWLRPLAVRLPPLPAMESEAKAGSPG